MSTKFKKGDRVQHGEWGFGTVVHIIDVKPPIGVCFDELTNGHDCRGRCADGRGRYCEDEDLTLIKSEHPAQGYDRDRFEAAKAAMAALIISGDARANSETARDAVQYADALIAELQKPKP
jgi:hypothetical protein